ncbi:MAG: alpha/beta fold hydrolase [Alphaproteobacteria bacterium]|nr:alpha/beta fold hydrolase [Alphaproteobacteria bacterium]
MKTTQSNGLAIAYLDEGEGPPVLLVHGFASNHMMNWRVTSWFASLSGAGFRAIALDCRGHGKSGKPHDPAAYAPALMADDLLAVLDAEGVRRTAVFGYSMGARIALEALMAAPGRFACAVLGGVGENLLKPPGNGEALAAALEADEIPEDASATAREFRGFAERTFSDRKALAACMRGQRVAVDPERLARLDVPVLVAAAMEDRIAGPAGPLAEAIPGAATHLVASDDHMRVIGMPAYKAGILAFLEEHAGVPTGTGRR